jgi:linoleate 10R-lipoxygenase
LYVGFDPPISCVTRTAAAPGSAGSIGKVDRGDLVYLNMTAVAGDAAVATTSNGRPSTGSPYDVDPHRPRSAYQASQFVFTALSEDFVYKTMAAVVKSIFSLNNVRKGPGNSGMLQRHTQVQNGIKQNMYLDEKHRLTPWAKSMTLQVRTPFFYSRHKLTGSSV